MSSARPPATPLELEALEHVIQELGRQVHARYGWHPDIRDLEDPSSTKIWIDTCAIDLLPVVRLIRTVMNPQALAGSAWSDYPQR